MKLLHQIVLRLIVPTIIGSALVSLLAVVLFFTHVPQQIDAIQAVLAENELLRFEQNSQNAMALVNAVFSHFADRASAAAAITRDFLLLDGFDPSASGITESAYTSYFAAQLDGQDPPLPTNPALYSAYYKNSITTLAQFNAIQPDNSTILDNVYRAASIDLTRIKLVQIGFPDGGWRAYPLQYNLSNFNPRTQIVCNGTNAPPDLRNIEGLDSRCRPFYTVAIAANANKTIPSSGITNPVFTTPYITGVSKTLVISVSVCLFKNAQLYAVQALQMNLAYLATKLVGISIMNDGYIYVMDSTGIIIMYPSQKTSLNIYGEDFTPSVLEVEFNNNTDLFTTFLALANSAARSNEAGTYTYQKPDGSIWTFAVAIVYSTSYILIVTAPNSDIGGLSS
ncbi:hypothetical protein HK100_003126, partial [Physocladia obscura]